MKTPKTPAIVSVIHALAIKTEQTKFLWDRRVPIGGLTTCGGDPGIGKTQVAMNLAANVSQGRLQGDFHGIPRDVLIISAEDSFSRTLNPRLKAANADMKRIHYIHVKREGLTGNLDLLTDMPQLERSIRGTNAVLIIIDPVVAHINGEINSNQDHDVRRAMAPLAQMSDKLQVAVLGIMHLNKDDQRKALYRVGGSIAFVAAARSVLLVAPDGRADQKGKYLLGHIKSNLGPTAPVWQYEIVPQLVKEAAHVIKTSCIKWRGVVKDMQSADIFVSSTTPDHKPEKASSKLCNAKYFLKLFLANSPKLEKLLANMAKGLGISMATLQRAKKELKLVSDKKEFDGEWWWRLPSNQQKQISHDKTKTASKDEIVESHRKDVPQDAVVINDEK